MIINFSAFLGIYGYSYVCRNIMIMNINNIIFSDTRIVYVCGLRHAYAQITCGPDVDVYVRVSVHGPAMGV